MFSLDLPNTAQNPLDRRFTHEHKWNHDGGEGYDEIRQKGRERAATSIEINPTKVKRTVRALRAVGLKVARVIYDGDKIEFVTADDPKTIAPAETAEDIKKLL
jgi:hypothetical protein